MKTKAIEILKQIKTVLSQKFDDMPQPVPVDPIVLTTADGVSVSVDKLEIGGKATVNGMPAPAATYVFTDGSTLTTDATGTITAVTTATTPVQQAAPPAPAPAPAPTPAPAPVQTAPAPHTMESQASVLKFSLDSKDENKTPEGIDKMFAQFASGTPEERIANLEIVAKALMEYSFGWEIRRAKEESEKAAAIKIYTDQLAPMAQQMETQKKTIEAQQKVITDLTTLIEEEFEKPVSNPPHPTKTSISFSGIVKSKKGIEKYAAAAQQVQEQKAAVK
jgi:hypothetical protein